MSHDHTYTNIHIEKHDSSECTITGEIPLEVVGRERGKALKRLAAHVEVDGFRKGRVPESIVVERLGEGRILEEVAEMVLGDAYAHIALDHKLNVIGRPAVSITKLAPGNPIGFKIETALMPEVALPDYKKIAAATLKSQPDPERVSVTDEEFDKAIEDLRTRLATPSTIKKPDGSDGDPLKPELTDEFVKKLGEFNDVADFKTKFRAQMQQEKSNKAKEARRIAVADEIIKKTKVTIPRVLIDGELDKMVHEMKHTIERMGLTFDDYLKRLEKDEAALRNEWKSEAERRATLQLVLAEIAKQEQIVPDETALEREVKHVSEHYPDAKEENVRAYLTAMMTNEKVFGLLEGGPAS